MARKFLNKYLPDREELHARLHGKWYMRPFDLLLHDPALWHVDRRGSCQALALGLFICCLPVPGHTVLAVLGALYWRVNLPVAFASVWVNNPLTFGPIYYFGYKLGSWLLQHHARHFPETITAEWLISEFKHIWVPLWLGGIVEGLLFALIGYAALDLAWRLSITGRWKLRQAQRRDRDLKP
jgi:uncharacterized protein